MTRVWWQTCLMVMLFLLVVAAPRASAGGGPENVALIVNSRSWSSRTIANYYQRLRHIPRNNVIHLDWTGDTARIDIDTFRRLVLTPVLNELRQRNLAHVDYLIYSSDLPFEIQFTAEKKEDDKFPSGSLTGLTFLYRLAMQPGNPLYAESNTNWYAAQLSGERVNATRGFRSSYEWSHDGQRVQQPASGQFTQRYLLSTMLGHTGPKGNTVAEVVTSLERSAAADGTFPAGTIYYCRTPDRKRSEIRDASLAFERAVSELERLGVAARVVEDVLPIGADDVQGLMTGTATFDWPQSRSTLRPGAIAEHLTSFGAYFHGTSQTLISEWIRYGAAGTSGTVIEPYGLFFKFPDPRIHVHYAQGCTLAEAFYQSVNAPYQLLVLGDPLCRPWARIPTVTARGLNSGATLSGEVEFQPVILAGEGQTIGQMRAFVDGKPWNPPPGRPFKLPTTDFSDGYHELRLVATERSAIETQGRQIVDLWFDNHGQTPQAAVSSTSTIVPWKAPLEIEASLAGATRLELYHNQQLIGTIDGGQGAFRVDSERLGSGPVTLDVAGVLPGSATERAWARPLRLEIDWPGDAR
jgi:hypothetical protein